MIYRLLLSFLLLSTVSVSAQSYLKSNEEILTSFNLVNGKKVVVALDKSRKYIVYRYGTSKHIEFEYPAETTNSFKKFKWYYYMRNGGPQNAGEEIYQLHFTNGDYTYKVYQQWNAETYGYVNTVGIIVVNDKTNKAITLKGILKSAKGGLGGLQDIPEFPVTDGEF